MIATARMINIAAVVFAVLGGSFFGLSSCGGYAWYKTAFMSVLATLTFTALWFPVSVSRPHLARAGIIVFVCLGYIIVEAIASTFYPGPPESWSEFWAGFRISLAHGPC